MEVFATHTDENRPGEGVDPDIQEKAKSIPRRKSKRLSIRALLKPHWAALTIGLLAVAAESIANLLQPWPLKVVLDNVLRSKGSHPGFMQWIESIVGTDRIASSPMDLRSSTSPPMPMVSTKSTPRFVQP